MKREQYITATLLVAAVKASDAGFSSQGREKELSKRERTALNSEIGNQCSPGQIENAIIILESALKISYARKYDTSTA